MPYKKSSIPVRKKKKEFNLRKKTASVTRRKKKVNISVSYTHLDVYKRQR